MSIRNATLGVIFLVALGTPAFAEDQPKNETPHGQPQRTEEKTPEQPMFSE